MFLIGTFCAECLRDQFLNNLLLLLFSVLLDRSLIKSFEQLKFN